MRFGIAIWNFKGGIAHYAQLFLEKEYDVLSVLGGFLDSDVVLEDFPLSSEDVFFFSR